MSWSDTPQSPSAWQPMPRGLDALFTRIANLEQQVREMRNNLLAPAGLKVEPDLLRVLGQLTVEGQLNVTGDTVIEGTLSLPAGIIDNDALAAPVGYAYGRGAAGNFAIPTGLTSVAPASITTPPGFTSAIVFAFVTAGGTNSTASYDFLFVKARTNGVDSDTMPYPGSPNGGWAAGPMSDVEVVPGLTGGQVITVSCVINAQNGAWAANASNRAFTRALGFFFR